MLSNKICISETTCFSPIITYAYLVQCQSFCIEQHEHYQRKSFRNRFIIDSAAGKQSITIPLEGGKNNNTPIREVKISYTTKWQLEAIHSIQSNYGKAPYFEFYFDKISQLLEMRPLFLIDYNQSIFDTMSSLLGIEKKIIYSENYIKSYNDKTHIDLRNKILPSNHDQYPCTPYLQLFEEKNNFLTNLSIIDLLFNLGGIKTLFSKFDA